MNANVQLLRLLVRSAKPKRRRTVKRAYEIPYPRASEGKCKNALTTFLSPLVGEVNATLATYDFGERGDARFDEYTPLHELLLNVASGWIAANIPGIGEEGSGVGTALLMGLGNVAEHLLSQKQNAFEKQMKSGLGVSFQFDAPWWEDVKESWLRRVTALVEKNAKDYAVQIAELSQKAVTAGWSVRQLTDEIKKLGVRLSEAKCRVIARDQIGKLQGEISKAQMRDVGLSLYVWSTSQDERVRGNPAGKYPNARTSHWVMEGLLCRWDDASVFSEDGGKTWKPRPSGAVTLHPGQDTQCRCVSLVYIPELIEEAGAENVTVEGVGMGEGNEPTVKKAPSPGGNGVLIPTVTDKELLRAAYDAAGNDTELKRVIADSVAIMDNEYKVMFKGLIDDGLKIQKSTNGKSFYSDTDDTINVGKKQRMFTLTHELAHAFDRHVGREIKFDVVDGREVSLRIGGVSGLSKRFRETFDSDVANLIKTLKKDAEGMRELMLQDGAKHWNVKGNDLLKMYIGTMYEEAHDSEVEKELFSMFADMMTAKKKVAFGGHSVSYFHGGRLGDLVPKYRKGDYPRYSEGFAGLCEFATVNVELGDGVGAQYLNECFADSIKLTKKAISDYVYGGGE